MKESSSTPEILKLSTTFANGFIFCLFWCKNITQRQLTSAGTKRKLTHAEYRVAVNLCWGKLGKFRVGMSNFEREKSNFSSFHKSVLWGYNRQKKKNFKMTSHIILQNPLGNRLLGLWYPVTHYLYLCTMTNMTHKQIIYNLLNRFTILK